MKKSVLVVVMVVVALNVAAVNRFFLPDFTIAQGETMQVAMILDNDEPFTAFQTDLLLPTGLSVIEDDGEYLFDLTGRNASDQTIISKLRDDGVLRMVSFCMSVKPYTGNSGALVVINLQADSAFVGPATIRLKNSFFVNVDGQQFTLPEASCEVLLYSQLIRGDVNGDSSVDVGDVTCLIGYMLNGCTSSFHIENAYLNDDAVIDISDVISLIDMILN